MLEEGKKKDIDAFQTIYHRSNAECIEAKTMSARYVTQDYMIEVLERKVAIARHQAVVAAQERRYILDQFEEFVLYTMAHFGR